MLPACTCQAASCALGRPLPLAPAVAACQRRRVFAPVSRPVASRAVRAGAARFGTGSARTAATEDASRDFASSLALMVLGVSI